MYMNTNTTDTKTVLESIHSLRRIREYSQDFMAFKLGISQNAFSKLESGKTPLTMERFFKIAELLEVSPVILIEGEVRAEAVVFNS
jgi:transcriptional regulator with XRE-family HTH domain